MRGQNALCIDVLIMRINLDKFEFRIIRSWQGWFTLKVVRF